VSFWPPESGLTVYPDKDIGARSNGIRSPYARISTQAARFSHRLFELFKKSAEMSTFAINMVNSEYSGNADDPKKLLFSFSTPTIPKTAHTATASTSAIIATTIRTSKSGQCYNSFWLENCYQTHFSAQCEDCANVLVLKKLPRLHDCFGCV